MAPFRRQLPHDDFLRLVAAEYRTLIGEGEKHPIKTLAERHRVDISAASRWVTKARDRRYIPRKGSAVPAKQAGSYYRTSDGWGVRWYEGGRRRYQSGFESKSAARGYFGDVVQPRLKGRPAAMPEVTFGELVERCLRAHAVAVQPRTLRSLQDRLRRPLTAFGDVPVRELEHQVAEIAAWRTTLPEGYRYAVMSAFRQVCAAGVRWGYLAENPAVAVGPNPQPRAVELEPLGLAEVEAIAVELGPVYGPLVVFAAETALRPEEWAAARRQDVDRVQGVVRVERTVVDGLEKPYGKTARSRRAVPLSARAIAALDELPAQLRSPLLFPAPQGGPIRLNNWRSPRMAAGAVRGRRRVPPAVRAQAYGDQPVACSGHPRLRRQPLCGDELADDRAHVWASRCGQRREREATDGRVSGQQRGGSDRGRDVMKSARSW